MNLEELQQQLKDVQTAITETIKSGKSYNITGSHSITNHDLKDLREQEAYIKRQIIRLKGYASRTKPNFG